MTTPEARPPSLPIPGVGYRPFTMSMGWMQEVAIMPDMPPVTNGCVGEENGSVRWDVGKGGHHWDDRGGRGRAFDAFHTALRGAGASLVAMAPGRGDGAFSR